jgi:hypothetical protein
MIRGYDQLESFTTTLENSAKWATIGEMNRQDAESAKPEN